MKALIRPERYENFFVLNSAEHECALLIQLKFLTRANSLLFNIAEHENFSAYKCENAFSCLIAEKISCPAKLSMKKV